MKPYSLDLREKIVESVKKGVPKSETARRFGVDRATVKRYCKQNSMNAALSSPGRLPVRDRSWTRRPQSYSQKTSRRGRGPPTLREPSSCSLCRSEEHTSELQSRQYLVCRLLLEKKKNLYV